MSITISTAYDLKIASTLTFSGGDTTNGDVLRQPRRRTGTLTPSSTVPGTKDVVSTATMSSGTKTVDLTAIVDDDLGTIDLTGLKVQLLIIENPSTQTHKVTITKGASNGYGLDAAGGSWTEVIDPGQSRAYFLNDSAPDVDGSHKTWDLTGTTTDALKLQLVAG